MRLTEEEALSLGFVKDAKGNWSCPCSDGPSYLQCRGPRQVSKLESDPKHEPQGAHDLQKENAGRGEGGYRIEVTAYYRRHVDPDNCSPKVFIDQLTELGVIPDDSSQYIREFVKRVVKIESWEPEVTKIEVYEIL